jgi:hypothetical protein
MPPASPCFASIGLEFTLKWLHAKPLLETPLEVIAHCRVASRLKKDAPQGKGVGRRLMRRPWVSLVTGFATLRIVSA